jgi:hypothetical protein
MIATRVALLLGVCWMLVEPGQAVPEVELRVVKYEGLKDAVLKNRGKVVLIDFWGNF